MNFTNFDDMIHEDRGVCLDLLPKGAEKFCSAGCSGLWYFDWIRERYGDVAIHYGVELFSPKPEGLPSNVRWIANSVSDMHEISSDEIDLLFSGQNIEHLYRDDLEGFLREANRVVAPGGYLVIDSPNRSVTQEAGYTQPQHTLEFSIDEAVTMVVEAGFEVVDVRGIWSCVDGNVQYKEVTTVADAERRISDGRVRPRDAFIWWIVCKKIGGCSPTLSSTIDGIISRSFSPFVAARFRNSGHPVHEFEGTDTILSIAKSGFVFYGPYVPLRAGEYEAVFDVKFLTIEGGLALDVVSGGGGVTHEKRALAATSVGKWQSISVPFTLSDYTEGVETRMIADGVKALVRLGTQIRRV